MSLVYVLKVGEGDFIPFPGTVITETRREQALYSTETNRVEHRVKSQHIDTRLVRTLIFGILKGGEWTTYWNSPYTPSEPEQELGVDELAAWSYILFKILKELPDDTVVESWALGLENAHSDSASTR